jgi:hypothetical protein
MPGTTPRHGRLLVIAYLPDEGLEFWPDWTEDCEEFVYEPPEPPDNPPGTCPECWQFGTGYEEGTHEVRLLHRDGYLVCPVCGLEIYGR